MTFYDVSQQQSQISRDSMNSLLKQYKTNPKAQKYYLEPEKGNKNWITLKRFQQMKDWVYQYEKKYGRGSVKAVWINCPLTVNPTGELYHNPQPKPTPITPSNGEFWSPRYLRDNNIIQDTIYWCSCNISQQCLYELYGVVVSESELARDMGTTTDGSSHDMIRNGIRQNATERGYPKPSVDYYNLSDIKWGKVAEYVADPNVAVFTHTIYRRKWGHYEYIAGVLLDKQVVVIPNSLSGGYMEYRTFKDHESYAALLSQPSIGVVKK